MLDAKQQLKQWRQWKRTIQLLQEAKHNIKDDDIKSKEIIVEYDTAINEYFSLVKRLEEAIMLLLTKEEKKVVIIFANNEDWKSKGYSKDSYNKILNSALMKMNQIYDREKDGKKSLVKHGNMIE